MLTAIIHEASVAADRDSFIIYRYEFYPVILIWTAPANAAFCTPSPQRADLHRCAIGIFSKD